jgi:hypothetical protein
MLSVKKQYTSACAEIVAAYREAGEPWPAESKSIAIWAINSGLWKPHRGRMIAQCANDLSRAMREEYYTDPQGRQVRVKHAARYRGKPEHGEPSHQKTLWDDIRTADYEHMARAFALRRCQIVGECKQLKIDIDSYNDNNKEGKAIQTIFDFRDDIADAQQPSEYRPAQPR